MSEIKWEEIWKKDIIMWVGNKPLDELNDDKIKSWLTALFQSEHLSLLLGSGLTKAISIIAGIDSQDMSRIKFSGEFAEEIEEKANIEADEKDRGKANIEDDFRVAFDLYKGLVIQKKDEEVLNE